MCTGHVKINIIGVPNKFGILKLLLVLLSWKFTDTILLWFHLSFMFQPFKLYSVTLLSTTEPLPSEWRVSTEPGKDSPVPAKTDDDVYQVCVLVGRVASYFDFYCLLLLFFCYLLANHCSGRRSGQ